MSRNRFAVLSNDGNSRPNNLDLVGTESHCCCCCSQVHSLVRENAFYVCTWNAA